MFKKEIKRKWLIDLNKIDNINNYKHDDIKIGILSQNYDSLDVSVISVNDSDYSLVLKDSGTQSRNNISYIISKIEFDISIQLSGSKILEKKRYYLPSSFDENRILTIDIYKDYDFVIAEYETFDILTSDTLVDEDWFLKEVTNDERFYSKNIVYNK